MDRDVALEDFRAYKLASQLLSEWITGAQALSLLRAAVTSGIFDAARTPRSAAQIAKLVGMDERQVADICTALDAHNIFQKHGELYQLSTDFALLASPIAFQPLQDTLDNALAITRVIETATSRTTDYWTLPSADRLALAKGVTGNPASSIVPPLVVSAISAVPEIRALYESGARNLELGCGVGGNLLGQLLAYPKLTSVGVEKAEDVLAEAQQRAVALGVANRVEWRQCDARSIVDCAAFDTVFWSQFFFPSDVRRSVLEVAHRALRPGGFLYVPTLGDPPSSVGPLRAGTGRAYAIRRMVYGSWGIPALTIKEIQAELEESGFEFIRVVVSPTGSRNILARRPT